MSKITVAGVRTNVQSLLEYSTNEKKRNFLETVELQVINLWSLGTPSVNLPYRSASRIMILNVTNVSPALSSCLVSQDQA